MSHLALYGHVNLDIILQLRDLPAPNTTVEITKREVHYGGTAGNVAALTANLGTNVKLASFVGEDFPQAYRAHLESLGVDCSELIQMDGYGTPTWWGFTDPEHNVMGFMDQGPMRDLEHHELVTKALDGAGIVHFCTGQPEYYVRVAAEAAAKKVPVVVDPGQELLHLYTSKTFEQMLEHGTYLFVNNHEMETALDKLGYGSAEQLFDHELQAIFETRGKDGCILHTENEEVVLPTAPVAQEDVVDATGAGDAFRAGWHAARAEGHDLVECAKWGLATATIAIQHLGAQTYLPPRDDVLALKERIDA